MSEQLPAPDPGRFPALSSDPDWVTILPAGQVCARIFRAGGPYPTEWWEFREYGPLEARFDPHPEPTAYAPGFGVLYAVLAQATPPRVPEVPAEAHPDVATSAFATCLLEVFQQHRIIQRGDGTPTIASFAVTRPLRLLNLSDSDWVSVAGGNAALTSGDRAAARAWARAIYGSYPELDGIIAASSVVPSARIVALWQRAADALPAHPDALLPLSRPELTGVLDVIAERYGYALLS